MREIAPLPGLLIPLYVTENKNIAAVDYALERTREIALVFARGESDAPVRKSHLANIGGKALITQSIRLADGQRQVTLHVQGRVRIDEVLSTDPFYLGAVSAVPEARDIELSQDDQQLLDTVKQHVQLLSQHDESLEEHLESLSQMFNPGELCDFVGSIIPFDPAESQRILDELNPRKRLELTAGLVEAHLSSLRIRRQIVGKVEDELHAAEHKELLREQIRVIREELGEEDTDEELGVLREKISLLEMPPATKQSAEKQLRRLQHLHADSSEAALARTYIDWLLDLPWNKRTEDRIDLAQASTILNQDHFGLDKTKDRILDFLGVRKLTSAQKGPILLFVGPPGVGKTSLGRSIARALGRKFVKVSLGGLRDEAELRGHRRTYVGAMPGRIIQGIKTAGTVNPVFMLDELDKVGSDFRGDPSSVLLEILDPEQNSGFEDHYLNLPFDLSEVMFIGTANVTDTIPRPLLDRMEIVEINGYTPQEKMAIAKRYLMPQEQAAHGLSELPVKMSDKTLLHLVNGYTLESGVRELRRTIAAVYRKVARAYAEEQKIPANINTRQVEKFLGPVRFVPDRRLQTDEVGIVSGLAWTQTGGELLVIEASVTRGNGHLSLTGQMGEVMQESGKAALTYVLSQASALGIDPGFFEKSNLHVHVPQAAIPKDGPSAGVTIATAIVSVLTGRRVSHDVAMTGEITLRGSVLPVGGVREKALAAHRSGVKTVILPKENEREIVEFPKYLRDELKFVAVEHVDEVFDVALLARRDQRAPFKPRPKPLVAKEPPPKDVTPKE